MAELLGASSYNIDGCANRVFVSRQQYLVAAEDRSGKVLSRANSNKKSRPKFTRVSYIKNTRVCVCYMTPIYCALCFELATSIQMSRL